ncbi:MAG: hypothetical protein RL754_365 [Bacteroidota bacterium]|jgi:intracellular sulfur oxidation DsrE/DsrF family protein
MKKFILSLTIIAAGFFTSCEAPSSETDSTIATEEVKTNNYFILNRNVEQLKAIGKSAGDMAAADGAQMGTFSVVVCGKAVNDLANAETMAPLMEVLNANGVNLVACGFSLKKFEVDAASLPEGVGVVPNGITYGLELIKEGAYSITL